jgi:hypothetical protein
VHLTDE